MTHLIIIATWVIRTPLIIFIIIAVTLHGEMQELKERNNLKSTDRQKLNLVFHSKTDEFCKFCWHWFILFSLYVNHIIIRTDHSTTTPVLNQLKAMETMVFTVLEAMKSVSYWKKVWESNRYVTWSASLMEAETRPTPLPISSIRFIANATGGLVPGLTTKLKDTFNRALILTSYGITQW